MNKTGKDIFLGSKVNYFNVPKVEEILKSHGAGDPNSDGIVESYSFTPRALDQVLASNVKFMLVTANKNLTSAIRAAPVDHLEALAGSVL